MEFIDSDDVLTANIQDKLHKLEDIKRKTAFVNDDIDVLKRDISTIKNKRQAATAALDREIRHRQAVLRARQRRKNKLIDELDRLQVNTAQHKSSSISL